MDTQINVEELAKALASHLKGKSEEITVSAFAVKYLDHARAHFKTWKAEESRMRLYINPKYGHRKLGDIRKIEILDFHRQIGIDKPIQANRVLDQLSIMYRLASEWGYFPENEHAPTYKIARFPEDKRDRFVTETEMTRLASSINEIRTHRYRVLFWLYLFTGLRRDELRKAKWRDIDFKTWEFKLPANRSKNGKAHYLPLPSEAMALLSTLPRNGEYIFSWNGRKPIAVSSLWRCWDRVRRRAILSDVRIHDLRRTVGSWLAQSGKTLKLIGEVLNHSGMDATLIYARFRKKDVADALAEHAGRLQRFF